MANPKIQVDITGDAKGLKKAVKEAEQAVEKIDDAVEKVGDGGKKGFGKLGDAAGDLARERLGPLGEAADLVGVDLDKMSTSTLVAGAAVVGLGGILANGVRALGEMTEEVRAFNDATGMGLEDSSRLVAVMDDLGISADAGATSVGRLAKNIDAGKLQDFGIAAQIAYDGTVDMGATLGAVADAMNATADPTERAAMGTALFGRSWADMMPLLRLGSGGIRDAMSNVKGYQVVTEETVRQQRELSFAVDDMQDAFTGLSMSLVRNDIPALTALSKGLAEVLDGVNSLAPETGILEGLMRVLGFSTQAERDALAALADEEVAAAQAADKLGKDLAISAQEAEEAAEKLGKMEEAGAALRAASPLAAELRRKTNDLAEASRNAAAAADEQKRKLEALNGLVMTMAGSTLAYENAQARTTEAADNYTEAQKAVTEAVAEFGDGTPEAIQAQRDLERAARDHSAAALDQAAAAVEQADKQAILNGYTLTADEKTRIYLDALRGVSSTTNDPTLKAGLDELITKTQAAAAAADAAARNYYAMEANASRAAAVARGANEVAGTGIVGSPDRLERNATGGNVSAGVPSIVGEAGPELFVPQSNGRILTADDLARVGTGGGGGVTINVNTPIGRPDDVVRWLREELRRADRAAR